MTTKSFKLLGLQNFAIEGKVIPTLKILFSLCQKRGYNGSMQNLQARVLKGRRTWAELSKPVYEKMSAARKELAARKKSEMHDICAELDARKKALAAKGEEE